MEDQPVTEEPGLDLQAIAARIKHMLSELVLQGTVFAERIGVPYSTLRAYLGAQRAPSAEFLTGVYRTFGYLPSWVLTGDLPMTLSGGSGHAGLQDGFVMIPLLPIHASAGNGTVVQEETASYNVPGLCFSRHWLSSRNLVPTSLRVIEVRGSSMDGVLSHGDRVLVDLHDTRPQSGFVYVLRQGEELLVKYCQLLPGGILRVSSANSQYATYDVELDKTPDVAIIGRVVASMHEW